jgi:hypothetical protein
MNNELNHVLKSINNSKIIEHPFHHLYIENIFYKEQKLDRVENVFEDEKIKLSLISKFFEFPDVKNISLRKDEVVDELIHTEIPSKFLNLIFLDEKDDGVILYDRNLEPVKNYHCKKNSFCVFAPSLHSYHISKRTTMFYINNDLHIKYEKNINSGKTKQNRIKMFKFNIFSKLQSFPLIEYKTLSLVEEFKNCKINDERGKIITSFY